jgi:hypothetical protein
MIRESTRHGKSMQKHGEKGCTSGTETIRMQKTRDLGVVVVEGD